ncbi:MAG: sigma 54-interacting transcriptional regulator [Desulfuromonadaceae bacterium]
MGRGKDRSPLTASASLRRHAEERLSAKTAERHPSLTGEEMQRLVHELEVHQIELEMQKDELCRAREELEASRNMYAELFDFAPVGYFIFDARGVILNVNFTGARMLGTERERLDNTPFTGFVADADGREAFSTHLTMVLKRQVMLKCEIGLMEKDGTVFRGQLHSVAATIGKMGGCIVTSIVDSTVRRHLEDKLKNAHDNLESVVQERTGELTRANLQLTQEIAERKRAEELLRSTYAEIKRLKDQLQAENIYLQQEVSSQYNSGEVIGHSKALQQVCTQVEQVAPLNVTVLLLGETGTGKGMVARAIHSSSARKERPMITVSCTALPANLIESELFGRERGAFTGSDARQIGRFELASGGTIFLDEIGEMPIDLQSKLLRVIQDGEFERLGSPRTIKTDVRIIAATNRDLDVEIKSGRFREDLFYRLNVFPIMLPPLRQRKDDIPLLVNHFVAKFNKKIGKKIDAVSKDTLNALQEYHWPGNVRELESVIERAVIISQGSVLQILDRFDSICTAESPVGGQIKALVELEHDHILQVLRKVGWRIEGKNGAAGLLGLNPSTLRARMRKFGIIRQ